MRFPAKHALALDPGMKAGSRQKTRQINGVRMRRDNLTQLAARVRVTI
jgi:hypothetical protein